MACIKELLTDTPIDLTSVASDWAIYTAHEAVGRGSERQWCDFEALMADGTVLLLQPIQIDGTGVDLVVLATDTLTGEQCLMTSYKFAHGDVVGTVAFAKKLVSAP